MQVKRARIGEIGAEDVPLFVVTYVKNVATCKTSNLKKNRNINRDEHRDERPGRQYLRGAVTGITDADVTLPSWVANESRTSSITRQDILFYFILC